MATQCESCVYYAYDEDWEDWVCQVGLDEDDLGRLLGSERSERSECPHYRLDDEYGVVRKQN